jgi:hypothetical protein
VFKKLLRVSQDLSVFSKEHEMITKKESQIAADAIKNWPKSEIRWIPENWVLDHKGKKYPWPAVAVARSRGMDCVLDLKDYEDNCENTEVFYDSGDSPDLRMADFLNHCYRAFYLAYRLGSKLSKQIAASASGAKPHGILAAHVGLKENLEKQLSRVPRNTVCGASEDFWHVRDLLNPIERIMTRLTGWKLGKLSLDLLTLLATELVNCGGRGIDAVSELSGKYPVNNAYEEAWPTRNADAEIGGSAADGSTTPKKTKRSTQ